MDAEQAALAFINENLFRSRTALAHAAACFVLRSRIQLRSAVLTSRMCGTDIAYAQGNYSAHGRCDGGGSNLPTRVLRDVRYLYARCTVLR
eukprot:942808-Rhodomonas_salina.5